MEKQLPRIVVESLYRTETPNLWKLIFPVKVKLSNGRHINIPAGYITDFTSAPKNIIGSSIVRAVVYQMGKHNAAVLIHDYLYDQKYYKGRKWADKEMLRWLLSHGCSKVKSYTMYYAVRWFGKSWWDN